MPDEGHKLDVLFETFFDITSLIRNGQADEVLYTRVLDCCLELLQADRALLVREADGNLERYCRSRGESGPGAEPLPRGCGLAVRRRQSD